VQLEEIRRAWYQPGRQIFIHGFRGVGKTSLAHTAAFQRQSVDQDPIILTCDGHSTFLAIIHSLFLRAFPSDPRIIREKLDASASVRFAGLAADLKHSVELGRPASPTSLNDAVDMSEFIARFHSQEPVVVIDEFDQMSDKKEEQALFANFVKQIGDRQIPLRMIFCGIGESIDKFFGAHESTYRYFHTVKLDRLDWEPRFEIIQTAADLLKIAVDENTRNRIARVSDGFPHFIHLICEKLFWTVFETRHERGELEVTADDYEVAVAKAVAAIDAHLKVPYEKATRKYQNDSSEILWAVADNHELQRPAREIFSSYLRLMGAIGKAPLPRERFNNRINSMKNETHGSILIGTRSGWYEFREKMMRGFARLKAAEAGVELEAEHPMQPRRHVN
jgi:hypothetical protein